MAVLVLLEGVAIVLLGLLVCGLLRSHAEILRKLHHLGAGDEPGTNPVAVAAPQKQPFAPRAGSSASGPAVDIVGATPAGESVQIGVSGTGHDTLVAFLSSGCATCGEFWRSFSRPTEALDLPDGTRLVVVTKSAAEESVSRLRELAPAEIPVVMSTDAWHAYAVPVTPFFVHVHGPSGQVVGQGAGNTWAQVISLLRQAGRDDRPRGESRRPTMADVEAGVDRKLLAAGVHPGDPSLYPSRQET